MHLESIVEQSVRIPSIGLAVSFAAGETIRTELSHKYTRASANALLDGSGLSVESWCTDESNRFALALVRAGTV